MRVLLTEGSSLTAREVVTCLGRTGHHIEVLDHDPMCLARFSRWVARLHRAPRSGDDPLGYLSVLESVVVDRGIDAVLPTHEQAWLLAAAQPLLGAAVRTAVAPAGAFARVQSKLGFAQLLGELGLPQPRWWIVRSPEDLGDRPFPYWLKAPYSTAGQGVWRIVDAQSRDAALAAHPLATPPLLAQQPAAGRYGQVEGVFARGRLIAVHPSELRGTGVGGSAAARLSVDHPLARRHIAEIGQVLGWHGGLTLDYLHEDGAPRYIECNARMVEPGNAVASGVNLPQLLLRLSVGERLPSMTQVGRAGVRTHSAVALLLGRADRDGSRRSLLGELADAGLRRGLYAHSAEQLTPLLRDPPSAVAATYVIIRLLAAPAHAGQLARRAVTGYSVGPDAVAQVLQRIGSRRAGA